MNFQNIQSNSLFRNKGTIFEPFNGLKTVPYNVIEN